MVDHYNAYKLLFFYYVGDDSHLSDISSIHILFNNKKKFLLKMQQKHRYYSN